MWRRLRGWPADAARWADVVTESGLFDRARYLRLNPDVAAAGLDPLLHFLTAGGAEGRDPHPLFSCSYYRGRCSTLGAGENPLVHYLTRGAVAGLDPILLFDTSFYMQRYPDVAARGRNPLSDYVREGAFTGRRPHALFDGDYYRERHPEVAPSGMNPLVHYVEHGAGRGLHPHPLFDTTFYLRAPDVAASCADALGHYLEYGFREGRDPNPLFKTAFYLDRYPDVASAGLNPLVHYVEAGAAEGREPSPDFDTAYWLERNPGSRDNPLIAHVRTAGWAPLRRPIEDFLPVAVIPAVAALPRAVDVIVPVYRGLAETRRCLESVRAAKVDVPWRLVVVNDASPDPEITAYLRSLPASDALVVVENQRNAGFVASVNRGMRLGPGRDVVLLNSDTEVADGWLDRLTAHAHHARDVATVTPFSNNATICSYPTLSAQSTLPVGETTARLDALCAQVNAGRHTDIPTAVGFCMYIRRDCLDAIGLFDETAYGAGYGEENDFCLRASAAGWRHLFAGDVFVFHAGEISFRDEAVSRRAQARLILLSRFPDYEERVGAYLRRDSAAPWRVALTAARYRGGSEPVVLFVLHRLGGGTEKHVADLQSEMQGRARFVILRAGSVPGIVSIEAADPADAFRIERDLTKEMDGVVAILRSFGVDRVHVHHVMGFTADLREVHRRLGVPLDFTVHDNFTVCPQFSLTDRSGNYCGEPEAAACNQCIAERPTVAADILWWRESHEWLFRESRRVICPSEDAAARIRRYHPAAPTIVVPHEEPAAAPVSSRPLRDGVLRIAVLGVLDEHKGVRLLAELAEAVTARSLPFEIVLIGYSTARDVRLPAHVEITGPYDDEKLPDLLRRAAPNVIWFPGRCPETYSFTLSAALRSGLPIVACRLGAFSERLRERPWTRVVPDELGIDALIDVFAEMRRELASIDPKDTDVPVDPPREISKYYRSSYLPKEPDAAPAVVRTAPRILLLPELHRGVPVACAYIRALLPLFHPDVRGLVDVSVVTPDEALAQAADVLVVQRLAVGDRAQLEALLDRARRSGQRVVYDMDDDLLEIPKEHPEYDHYAPLSEVVRLAVGAADEVWTSTEVLAERARAFTRATVTVMPNALDETLWWSPLPAVAPPSRVGLLYAGTPTHEADFALVTGVLRQLHEELRDRIDVAIIGIVPRPVRDPAWRHVDVPLSAAASYPAFVNWFRRVAREYHIGLAPLVDNPFSRGKSAIKFLEYAAAGLVPVCSDVGPYSAAVTHGVDGLLVGNTEDAWYETLRALITDVDRRTQLSKAAGESAERSGRLAPLARRRVRSLTGVVCRTP